MAAEGLHDCSRFNVDDLDDACRAADGDKGVAGGRAAGPGCRAERLGLKGEVVMEVGDNFDAIFGVRAGDDGFAAANDGEDGIDVRGGERVEVGAVVGSSGDSFGRLSMEEGRGR